MAEIGDVLQEWHKAKPSEKLLIVGISVAALGIAIYFHSQTKASASTAPTNPVGGDAGNPATVQPGGTPSNGQPVAPGTPTPTPVPAGPPVKTGNPPPKNVLLPHAPVQVPHPVRGTVVTRVAQRSAPIHGTTAVVTRRPVYVASHPIIGTGRTRMAPPPVPPAAHGHTGITNPYVGLQPTTYAGNPGSSTGAAPTHGRVA